MSYLWAIPDFAVLATWPEVVDVCYSACMWGGRRDKKQRLRGTVPMLSSMAVACDRSHEHAPWKEGTAFRTGEEAEYPEQVCRHVANKFRAPLGRKRKAEHQHTTTEEWKAAAKQPKNNKE